MSTARTFRTRMRGDEHARRDRGGPPPVDHAPGQPLVFDLSVRLRRPASTAYAALADVQDLEPLPRSARVRMAKSPPGPTRAGTRWHEQVRVAPGLWMRIESIATHATPPTRLGMDFRTAWFTGHLDYEIEHAPGGSILHQRETVQMRTGLGALGSRVDGRLRPRLLERLADVRDAIEHLPLTWFEV